MLIIYMSDELIGILWLSSLSLMSVSQMNTLLKLLTVNQERQFKTISTKCDFTEN